MNRRKFLHQTGMAALMAGVPGTCLSYAPSAVPRQKLTFGIVADVHKDLMPDASHRLEQFIQEAEERKADFIIQLGDFCMGERSNRAFMGIWESFRGPKYHVLGNHDMDKNSKKEMLDFWGMPQTYYSYDFGGYHFIVLDANFIFQDGKYIDYERANFYIPDSARTFVHPEQIDWFKADLAETRLPTLVFSHQSLWNYTWGINNRLEIQKIMESHKEKVICCFNGHDHIDYHHHQNGIDYLEINSMSYHWTAATYQSWDRFPKADYEQYPSLPNIAAYEAPLYAFASLDPKGILQVEGVRSQWMSPSPYTLGMPKGFAGTLATAEISDYRLSFGR
ncbi:Calcineurin-like phosphoesterase [Cyclobacterium xiamenense]|uniref:Calcineurin-like phosphoesterase n=1 Tax=Cyclobacterium xiamenense TaxID=1297121 RepID=A0A1H6XWZ6_9BACT|nr:metallophosphoesterase [Cyclobacterium xiamenense]SEJ33588.1 Calcineurin-like phosphoesterase [Cyclobacterium xiamenense]